MAISKLIFNGVTQMDITDTTATADKILSSYGAYGADGIWMSGTASGGGGGLEYETGTYTPTEDTYQPTINFTNQHTGRPCYLLMVDVTGSVPPSDSGLAFALENWYDTFGGTIWGSQYTEYYARANWIAFSTALTTGGSNISSLTGSYNTCLSYYVTSSSFSPYTGATSRYWRTTRTYKWIAVWAPTS